MREVRLEFKSGGLSLEGVLALPGGTGPFPAVIVCHPHSLYGGSMSNSVVVAICQALARQSIAALRFNFRGVGRSGGNYGGGIDEQEDVRAALALVPSTSEIDPKKIGLAGYSFGAGVNGLNLVNVPVGTAIGAYTIWVLVQDETDDLFDGPSFSAERHSAPAPA